jgi:hypothetical protein
MMKTRRIAALVVLTFLPHAVALPAFAQPADDPVTLQARARFKEGVDFYDKGQYENARLAFLQAYALKKHPAVLLNLAQSSAKSNHPLEASKYFQQFLRESTTVTPQQRRDAETGLVEVRQKLGRIEIVAPAGSEITLDDKEKLGTAPFAEPIDVDPGTHSLKSSTETVTVTANAGQRVTARFGGAAPAPAAAVVPVPAPATANGGASSPTAEPPQAQPQPGGGEPPPGADTTKKYNVFSPPKNMTPVYIGLAAGGVGLVGAIVFAAFKSDAQSKADSVAADIRKAAQSRNPPLNPQGICNSKDPQVQKDFGGACATLQDNNKKVDTNALIANISLGVMGAGLVLAAGWYLFAPKADKEPAQGKHVEPKPTGPIFSPYAGSNESGLTVLGTF